MRPLPEFGFVELYQDGMPPPPLLVCFRLVEDGRKILVARICGVCNPILHWQICFITLQALQVTFLFCNIDAYLYRTRLQYASRLSESSQVFIGLIPPNLNVSL
jgi:hypothetical protein